jgi:hypothetical protein
MSEIFQVFIILIFVGAWLTHVVVCLIHAKYVLLLAGVFFPPIGLIHGVGNWLGVSW